MRQRRSLADDFDTTDPSVRLDISSLVDVIFLLLLFFIVSSRLANDEIINIRLPQAGSGQAVAEAPLELNLAPSGSLFIGPEEVPSAEITNRLGVLYDESPDRRLLIRADEGVSHGNVVKLYDAAKQAGFTELGIGVVR